ncbi:hypothetical protein, partial [Paenibacillus sp. HW567]|uniref:hypothetical protein n=1 Tax=Paenibacillus sp. HW567 TaxID=1034769 RepID=UPI001E4970A2
MKTEQRVSIGNHVSDFQNENANSRQMFQNERIALSKYQFGEFDPGSGRTLAACLIHASRAELILRGKLSGGRV